MTTKTPKKTKTDTQFEQLLSEISKVSKRIDQLESVQSAPLEVATETKITAPNDAVPIEPVQKPVIEKTETAEIVAKKPDSVTISRKFYIFLIVVTLLSLLSLISHFFRNAPITGRSELTVWTKQQTQQLPLKYQTEIKAIFREAYQETATAIQSKEIVTTTDARLRLSQLIQAKILSLNRLSKNPQELETILQTMQPLSNAIGERLAGDVSSGKMQDNLESVQKAFIEISEGMK
jgi:hypothetical protein